MKNCLVTTLKGSVDNNNLDFYGAFSLILKENSSLFVSRKENNVSVAVKRFKIIGDAVFSDSTYTENYGKELTDNTDNTVYVKVNSASKLYIFDYYTLQVFGGSDTTNISCTGISPNVINTRKDLIRFMTVGGALSSGTITSINTDIEVFKIPDCVDVNMDISLFSACSKINTILVGDCHNVTGNLASLTGCYALKSFNFNSTKIAGQIERLVEGIFGHNVNPSLTFLPNNITTLNGNAISGGHRIEFGNSIAEIYKTSPARTLVATYNGSTWTYA